MDMDISYIMTGREGVDNLLSCLKRELDTYILQVKIISATSSYCIIFPFKAPFSYTTPPFIKRMPSLEVFQ